jgi:acetyl-CoA carboxylase beta subunit
MSASTQLQSILDGGEKDKCTACGELHDKPLPPRFAMCNNCGHQHKVESDRVRDMSRKEADEFLVEFGMERIELCRHWAVKNLIG